MKLPDRKTACGLIVSERGIFNTHRRQRHRRTASLCRKSVATCVLLLSMLVPTTTIAQVVRIMPLGDSITAGEHYGYPAFGERTGYRKPLYELLTADAYDVNFVGSLNWGFNVTPFFDCDHEGHPGWTASQIASNVYRWLEQNPPDIVLAHVGTNGLSINNDKDVERMLDEIDRYEMNHHMEITVFLARIIHRYQMDSSAITTAFNDRVEAMALSRVRNRGDKIIIVDMENGAGIDYMADGVDMLGTTYPGVSYDRYHPSDQGNMKMAKLWFEHLAIFLSPYGATHPYPANRNYQWPGTFTGLRWSVPAPRHPDDVITCDVYIGTDPNELERIAADEPIDSLPSQAFSIVADTVYYWRVDCYDPNAGSPALTEGRVWTFHTCDPVPKVDAGQDQSWRVGPPLWMTATVTDEGDPNAVLHYLWSVESAPAGAPDVAFDDTTIQNPLVSFSAPGVYILRLSVSDDGPVESQQAQDIASDTVTITVGPPIPRRWTVMRELRGAYNREAEYSACIREITTVRLPDRKTTFGLIVGTRGFFNPQLAREARRHPIHGYPRQLVATVALSGRRPHMSNCSPWRTAGCREQRALSPPG